MDLSAASILVTAFLAILTFIVLKQNLTLKGRLSGLKKEVEIKDSKLSYQKEQLSTSADYFSSAEVIILEMMEQINAALKSEEGDLSEKILQIIFAQAQELFRPKKSALFKVDSQNRSFGLLCSFGYKDKELRRLSPRLDENSSFLGWSALVGRFISCDDARQDPLLSHLAEGEPLQCRYSQPLKVDNKVKAVLCVGPLLEQMDKDVIGRFFSILANIASVALSDALLTQQLREQSVRDGLTGLYNHSYFQKWLQASIAHLREKGRVLSVVIVDLDHFKKINDAYGHQAGDLVLKDISAFLNNLQAENYLCARYGGEELALVFVGKDAEQTRSIMEDARRKIMQMPFKTNGRQIHITVSIGIAEVRFSETKKINKRELIESADQALYKAKSTGRNKLVVV